MDFLVGHPGRIVVIAILFILAGFVFGRGVGAWSRGARPCYFAALLWSVYAVWEYVVTREGADIRVDLLLIYPVLLIVSLVTLIMSLRRALHHNAMTDQ